MARQEFKFAHLRDPYGNRTVGYRINDDTNTVDFGISYCNPKDQFVKAIGREIVLGRIHKGVNEANTRFLKSGRFELSEINGSTKWKDIVDHIDFRLS